MAHDRESVRCDEHGEAYVTFLCAHLASNPAQEWFSDYPTEVNPWPDSWCAECDAEFQKEGEWNDANGHVLDIRIFCHRCYENARAQGSFEDAEIGSSGGAAVFGPKSIQRLDGPVTFTLDSGVELHEESLDTFQLPPEQERTSLRPGQFAKLIFRMTDGENVAVERMWVRVLEVTPAGYRGVLDNQPYCTESVGLGLIVEFLAEHVIQISSAGG